MAVVDTYDGTFTNPGVIEQELADAGVSVQQDASRNDCPLIKSAIKLELDSVTKIAREETLALMILNGSNFKRYLKV